MLEASRRLFRIDGAREKTHKASYERVTRAEQVSRQQHLASERAARVIAEMQRTDRALRGTRNG